MTVIAMAMDHTGTWLASDGQGTSHVCHDFGPKLVELPQSVIAGFGDSYLLGTWLRRSFAYAIQEFAKDARPPATWAQPWLGAAWLDFLEEQWLHGWRPWANKQGYGEADGDGASVVSGVGLIAWPGGAVHLSPDGAVLPVWNRWAIGSGSEAALGSLESTVRWTSGKRRVIEAVRVAKLLSPTCGGETYVVHSTRPKEDPQFVASTPQ